MRIPEVRLNSLRCSMVKIEEDGCLTGNAKSLRRHELAYMAWIGVVAVLMDQVLDVFIDGILILHKSLKLTFYTLREPGELVSPLKLGSHLTETHLLPLLLSGLRHQAYDFSAV